jgi:uncharacterized protein
VIVVDTTVLLYAVGGSHPLQRPAVRVIEAIRRRRVRANTTVEVVQEFAHVFGRRRDRAEAAHLGRACATLLAPLLTPERSDLERGLTLYERHAGLGAFDAVLAAVAVGREAEALVSADRAFAAVPDLPYVDLAAPALDELVTGG